MQMRRRTKSAMIMAVAALAASMLLPASAGAARTPKVVEFGALLTRHTQPSNSNTPHSCREQTGMPGNCTRVLMEAYRRPDTGQLAPKTGHLSEVKIIAGDKGLFYFELAKTNPKTSKSEIVVRSRRLSYKGQGGVDDGGPYIIETFKISMHVVKGEYLAIRSLSTSFENCSGGGDGQLIYQPPLAVGGPARASTAQDGCLLLLEAVYSS
jgi:hypothetical protein